MDELLTQHALSYARRHQLRLAERLGHGIHGIVYAAERNLEPGNVAVKVHRSREVHERERNVYLRLREACVAEILGFNVPQLIRSDDELLVIEMSIVSRPFVLDFAGAYLDNILGRNLERMGIGEARPVRGPVAESAGDSERA